TAGGYADDLGPVAADGPAWNNVGRAGVGAVCLQVSAFDARKVGAALVARNIAHIVETYAREKRREWQPIVYCWRGGQRSRALVHVLCEIGWRAAQLDGGYRAYRRRVVSSLAVRPQ